LAVKNVGKLELYHNLAVKISEILLDIVFGA